MFILNKIQPINENLMTDKMKSAYKSIKAEISKEKSKLDFLSAKFSDLQEIDSTIYSKFKDDVDSFMYGSSIINPKRFVDFLTKYSAELSDQISLYGYIFEINSICPNSNYWTIQANILVAVDPSIVKLDGVSDLNNYSEYIQDASCELEISITSKK